MTNKKGTSKKGMNKGSKKSSRKEQEGRESRTTKKSKGIEDHNMNWYAMILLYVFGFVSIAGAAYNFYMGISVGIALAGIDWAFGFGGSGYYLIWGILLVVLGIFLIIFGKKLAKKAD